MSNVMFRFDPQKAVEIIIYLASRVDNPTMLTISKLLYFADKTSLEYYGRFISGETYVAMEFGPVPSNSYDLMKAAKDTNAYGFEVSGYKIKPLRDPNIDKLSRSDLKCLDQVIRAYGDFPRWQIVDLSHDEAWERNWDQRGNSRSVPISVEDITSTMELGDDLLEFIKDTHKPDR